MNTFRLFLIRYILKLIPISSFFKFKTSILKFSGAKISKTARIFSNVKIYGNGELVIGNDAFIGHEVIILVSKPAKIKIGNNVDIAPRVYIGTGSHEIEPNSEHIAGKGINLNIEIGDGSWIGANTTILPGVSIGKKVVIAAGSVVNKNIPSFTIAAGIPAKPIKKWDIEKQRWKVTE